MGLGTQPARGDLAVKPGQLHRVRHDVYLYERNARSYKIQSEIPRGEWFLVLEVLPPEGHDWSGPYGSAGKGPIAHVVHSKGHGWSWLDNFVVDVVYSHHG